MSENARVSISHEGHFTRIELIDEATRNSLTQESIEGIYGGIEAAHERKSRVIVLSALGKSFCAGANFAGGFSPAENQESAVTFPDLLLRMVGTTIPIVASVQGHALGGGLGLVAASTFVVASSNAEFGTPEINVGLFPMTIMAVLDRIVPRRALLEMMLLGERFSATRAMDLGLVQRVVEPAALSFETKHMAEKFAAKSPAAISRGLRAYKDQSDVSLERALPMLFDRLVDCLSTNDAREGLLAFMEKRSPEFTGT